MNNLFAYLFLFWAAFIISLLHPLYFITAILVIATIIIIRIYIKKKYQKKKKSALRQFLLDTSKYRKSFDQDLSDSEIQTASADEIENIKKGSEKNSKRFNARIKKFSSRITGK